MYTCLAIIVMAQVTGGSHHIWHTVDIFLHVLICIVCIRYQELYTAGFICITKLNKIVAKLYRSV